MRSGRLNSQFRLELSGIGAGRNGATSFEVGVRLRERPNVVCRAALSSANNVGLWGEIPVGIFGLRCANIAMGDGSVQLFGLDRLQQGMLDQGAELGTNYLAVPSVPSERV